MSFIETSSSRRLPFFKLHGAHEVTTFSHTESPPRLRGMTWSSVSRPLVVRASGDLPLHRPGHTHVLHEPDHVRPLEGVAGRAERLVELLEHLGLALEHEHVCTTHGCDVQWLVARVQDEYLRHSQKNVATRSQFATF